MRLGVPDWDVVADPLDVADIEGDDDTDGLDDCDVDPVRVPD